MSAIDFYCDVGTTTGKHGEKRVVITFNGKFLPHIEQKKEDSISSDNDNKPKKKGKYVPIEEWDANRNLDDMSNEERLQWECQRNGNQYRQNEILMNNLKGF